MEGNKAVQGISNDSDVFATGLVGVSPQNIGTPHYFADQKLTTTGHQDPQLVCERFGRKAEIE